MFIYILMIGLVAFGCFFYMQFPYVTTRKENMSLLGQPAVKCYRHPMFWAILIVLLFPFVIRYMVGTDFYGYQLLFEQDKSLTLEELFSKRDFSYYVLERINNKISGDNWYYHCLIIGLIVYFPVLYYYSRYSNNLAYSMLIYIFFMLSFSVYNATRQTIAVSFMLMAMVAFMDKKYSKTIIYVFLAYSFHSTMLIILPFILLSFFNYKNKSVNFLKVLVLISSLFLKSAWTAVVNFLENVGQNKLAEDYSDLDLTGNNGVNILRIIVYLVPVILGFIYGGRMIENVKEKYGEDSILVFHTNFLINAMQFALLFMIVGQSNWIFARFSSYFAIFTPIFLSYVYPVVKKEFRSLYCIISVVLFFVYMYLLLPVDSNLLPFKTEWGWYFR